MRKSMWITALLAALCAFFTLSAGKTVGTVITNPPLALFLFLTGLFFGFKALKLASSVPEKFRTFFQQWTVLIASILYTGGMTLVALLKDLPFGFYEWFMAISPMLGMVGLILLIKDMHRAYYEEQTPSPINDDNAQDGI